MSITSKQSRNQLIAAIHYATANFAIADRGIFDGVDFADLPVLQQKCRTLPADPKPGMRRRVKSEYRHRPDGQIDAILGTPYQQDYEGAVLGPRTIAEIDDAIKALGSFQGLLREHRALARLCQPALFEQDVIEKIHLVTYAPVGSSASFSHPLENHSDRESHVGMTVLEVSANLEGGGNNVFKAGDRLPSAFIRLEALENLLLGPDCFHGVAPMGSKDGLVATRSIGLFTYERANKDPANDEAAGRRNGRLRHQAG